jgi:hypothetical protein
MQSYRWPPGLSVAYKERRPELSYFVSCMGWLALPPCADEVQKILPNASGILLDFPASKILSQVNLFSL